MDCTTYSNLKDDWPNQYQVEHFGHVNPHQSQALNIHLELCMKKFELEYIKAGGKVPSAEYEYDKWAFAGYVSNGLIESYRNDPLDVKCVITSTEFHSSNLDKPIKINQGTDFQKEPTVFSDYIWKGHNLN